MYQIDIIEYLRNLPREKLDVAIMKYTIDHIENLEVLFELLSQKLQSGGRLVASIGSLNPELKSISTNARFLYNGAMFPENETRTLCDGDSFTVMFFNISGDQNSGYLEGAETVKWYHSTEKIKQLAEEFDFEMFLGDWKELLNEEKQMGESMDQGVLVLRKKTSIPS